MLIPIKLTTKVPPEYCNWCGSKFEWIRQFGKLSEATHRQHGCIKPDPIRLTFIKRSLFSIILSLFKGSQ
jgi:hypothetical protein